MDFHAIATALAGRFAPAQVTPPSGLTNVRTATADVPNNLPPTPCVLVFLGSGDFDYYPSKRDSGHDFIVRFYLDQVRPMDSKRASPQLLKWMTVLASQLQTGAQLGGIVTIAQIRSYQAGKLDYAGKDYWGVELVAHIVVNEAWSPVP